MPVLKCMINVMYYEIQDSPYVVWDAYNALVGSLGLSLVDFQLGEVLSDIGKFKEKLLYRFSGRD